MSAPDRPALAPAAAGGTGIEVGWNAVAGAGGYVVERSADGVVWEPAAETGAGVLAYQDPILPGGGGHRYFYRVSAKDPSGVSKPSAVASLVNRPDAPGELAVTTAGPSTLILNWRDVRGETGYRIERALGEGGEWAVLANVGQNVPSFADKDLGSGRPYRYRVVATVAGGGDSLPVEVGATTPFTAVDRFVVSALQPRRVALRWDPILDAAPGAYVVERSDAGGAFRSVATVSEPRWTDESLVPLRRYRYRVVGTNVWGKSATSTTLSLLAPREEPVPAPWRKAEVNTSISGDDNLDRATGAITAVAGGINTGDYEGFGAIADSFRFIYQPLLRDGTITVRVVSQDSSPRRAMAGVMVRQSLDPSSPYVFAGMSPMYGEATQQRRDPGGFAQMISTQVDPGAWWFRLVVTGGSVTAYASKTGSSWAPMWGSSLALGFEPLYIGLAVTSGSTADLTTTVFDRLAVSNRAPWVESPAYASPAAVTELTTELSFEASDDHGPEDLKYTWSATQLPGGADPPTFSANGTNAAKVVTATFSRAGTYVFTGRATDAQGLSISSQVRVEVTPVASKVFVLPSGRAVAAGGTLQVSGTVVDQFGDELAQPPPAEWTSNYGVIDENGLYTAAPQIYDDAITGWFPTDSGWMWDTVDVHVVGVAAGAPTLESAVSRKVHGRAGAVDLPLPLAGARPAVEPRLGGPTTLRFTFSEPVRLDRNEDQDGVLDADDFALRNAQFVSATFEAGGGALTLVMKPLHPGRVVTMSLLRLIDADGTRLAGDNDVSVVGVFGDADRSGTVTPADLLAVRRKLAGRVRTTDLWLDLDLNGVVNAIDLAHAKRRQGFALLDNPPGESPA